MAKSKKRQSAKKNTQATNSSSNNNNNENSESNPYQPLNMFFGGPRAAGYASIPNVRQRIAIKK